MNKNSDWVVRLYVCACARAGVRARVWWLDGKRFQKRETESIKGGMHARIQMIYIYIFFEGTRGVKMLLIKVWKKVTENK